MFNKTVLCDLYTLDYLFLIHTHTSTQPHSDTSLSEHYGVTFSKKTFFVW